MSIHGTARDTSKRGELQHISIGDLDNSITIDAVILELTKDGTDPIIISYEDTGQADEAVSWDGLIKIDQPVDLYAIYSNATIGDDIVLTALVWFD